MLRKNFSPRKALEIIVMSSNFRIRLKRKINV